ncbi:high-affinity zinc uptake system ATP-binding protein ZnuC [Andreesenia angusta]|uniref:High-affinity zinc uptake system ATP-binding protein ZnuC n=1 Tax=Andreesenia angusta TaxID=39480 RepID=A0A1S1V6V2_9FIRM|nr:metal ABC transporter ATP-binding protein [Andreesenia angusta]OHW62140.1 high-affinity zinc uptake system ATP-binding protein ZnuC [Andreesenia angusta]
MDEKILELNNLTFGYENGENLLENVDLEIRSGEYVGIVGKNGSAKSTLLKLMLGLLKPKSGDIYIKGKKLNEFKEWGSIGYLSQQVRSFNSNFPATVEEVVGANLYSKKGIIKMLGRKDRESIEESLKAVGMENYKTRIIGTLSGGQQQRVFIARLLVSNPDIIFMDEPLVGVDTASQGDFYEILDDLNKKLGISLIMVTHDVVEIFGKADKVLLLNDRKIIEYDLSDMATQEERMEIAERDIKNLI